jgi:small GTP-binding protein
MQVGSLAFKVVLLGNSGSGKTSLLNCALAGPAGTVPQPTIGCNCSHRGFRAASGESVTLSIWDTAGQELYRSIVPIYVRDADAGLLVYDVTDQRSFAGLEHWAAMLRTDPADQILLYLLGNKVDLAEGRPDGDDHARAYAEKIKAKFFRVSAVKGTNVDAVFTQVATDLAAAAVKRATGGAVVALGREAAPGHGCC